MPHIPWNNESDIPIINDSFVETLNDHFLTQVNKSPTRDNNILDLIITTVPEKVNITDIVMPHDAGIYTDHNVIHYEFNALIANEKLKRSRYVYDYNKTNFDAPRSSLANIDLTHRVTQTRILEDFVSWLCIGTCPL